MPAMQSPGSSDWAAARGEKWLAHLSGLEPMLTPVDTPLVDALRLDAPLRIADVGCGSGATTLAIARRAAPGSVVHGFDISRGLVEKASSRLGEDRRDVVFHVADMASSAPPGGRYDRLVTRFGIMFFEDPPAAFANIARWLASGGRFAFAVWGPSSENHWLTLPRDAVAQVVDVPKPDPDAPGPFRYADAEKLRALLSQSGFRDVEVNDWRGKLPLGGERSVADAATFALTSLSCVQRPARGGRPRGARRSSAIAHREARRAPSRRRGVAGCVRAHRHRRLRSTSISQTSR